MASQNTLESLEALLRSFVVHAIPRISHAVLAERRSLATLDAHDGSWRVYVATAIVFGATALAFCALSFVSVPLPPLMQPYDVAGAASTLAAILASVRCMRAHSRAREKSEAASACVCVVWLTLAFAIPSLLLGVLVLRFGMSA